MKFLLMFSLIHKAVNWPVLFFLYCGLLQPPLENGKGSHVTF